MISPSGKEYRGNYFTDDDDQNGNHRGRDANAGAMGTTSSKKTARRSADFRARSTT